MGTAIHYKVRTNNLLGQEGKHAAMVQPIYTAELEDVVERMAFSGASVPAVLGVLEHFFRAIEIMLLEGVNVNTPVANFHLSIEGTFTASDERFDRRRHRVVVKVTPGKRLRRAVRRRFIPVERVKTGPVGPYIYNYVDYNSGEHDSVLTPGGMGQVLGHHLKFVPHDPRQGVFFIAEDGRATPCSITAENSPGRLTFLVPDLPAGSYFLEVRATPDDSDTVRSDRLVKRLVVSGATASADDEAAEIWESDQESEGRLPFNKR